MCISQTYAQHGNELASRSRAMARAKTLFEQAEAAQRKQNLKQADSLVCESIFLDDRNVDAYILRARIREDLGLLHPALVDYETALLLTPKNIEVRFKKGQLHYALGNYEQSINDINIVLNSDEIQETTTVFFQTEADGNTVGVSTLNRMQADLFHLRALSHHGLREHNRAIDDFKKAILRNSKEHTYHNNLGMTYMAIRDTTQAIVAFKEAYKLSPDNETAQYNLALLKVDTRYLPVTKSGQNDTPLPNLIKLAYESFSLGDYRAAENYYQRAIAIDNKNASLLMDMGRTKSKLGRQYEALGFFKKSLEIDDNLTKNYYLTGNAYFQLREYSKACDAYAVYLTYHQDDASAFYNYGLSLQKIHKKEEACYFLKKALSLGLQEATKAISAYCQNP